MYSRPVQCCSSLSRFSFLLFLSGLDNTYHMGWWEIALMTLICLHAPTHFSMGLCHSFPSRDRLNDPTLNCGFRMRTCFGYWHVSWCHQQNCGSTVISGSLHSVIAITMTRVCPAADPRKSMRDQWSGASPEEPSENKQPLKTCRLRS